jgi:hypothetical protein
LNEVLDMVFQHGKIVELGSHKYWSQQVTRMPPAASISAKYPFSEQRNKRSAAFSNTPGIEVLRQDGFDIFDLGCKDERLTEDLDDKGVTLHASIEALLLLQHSVLSKPTHVLKDEVEANQRIKVLQGVRGLAAMLFN